MSSVQQNPNPHEPSGSRSSSVSKGTRVRTHIAPWNYFLFTILAIAGFAVDIVTKEAVFRWRGSPFEQEEPWWLIRDYVGIETAVNPGALFGMGGGLGWLFAAVSILALIGIAIWLFVFRAAQSSWISVAMGCIVAGILGNLYDRLGLGYQVDWPVEWKHGVRDWILLRYRNYTWPNFNIADSLLVCGTAMLFWYTFRQESGGAPTTAAKS